MTAEPLGRRETPTATTSPGAALRGQVARFAAVGSLCTLVQLGLYAGLDQLVPDRLLADQGANLVALTLSTIVNTALNRRWTFAVRGRGALTHQAQAFAVFALTWGLTAAALALLHAARPTAPTLVEVLVLGLATGLSTVVRFVAMRRWIFARR